MNTYEKQLLIRLEDFSTTLSDKNIKLIAGGIPQTDGHTITLPIFNFREDELFGLAGHESFHIRGHSFTDQLNNISKIICQKYNIDLNIANLIVNITEDFRINEWLRKIYPGTFREYYSNIKIILKKMVLSKKNYPLVAQISFLYNQMKLKFRKKIQETEKINIADEEFEEINNQINKLKENISPEYGVIAAEKLGELYAKIRKRHIKENDKNNQEEQKQRVKQLVHRQEVQQEQHQQQEQKQQQEHLKQQEQQKRQQQEEQQKQQQQQQQQEQKQQQQEQQQEYQQEQKQLQERKQLEEQKQLEEKHQIEQEHLKQKQEYEQQAQEQNQRQQENQLKQQEKQLSKSQKRKEMDHDMDNNKDIPSQTHIDGTYPSTLNEKIIRKEIRKVIDNLSKNGSINEKDLEKAAKKAEEEIEKIIQQEIHGKPSGDDIYQERATNVKCKRIKKNITDGSNIITPSYRTIIKKNKGLIRKITRILNLKSEKITITRGHKTGRMNRDFLKAYSSNYEYKTIYSKPTIKKGGKIKYLLDLSGSMSGNKMKILKESVIIMVKALENIADTSVVGYCGNNANAHNIVFKEFGEPIDENKLNSIGLRKEGNGTPTSVALKTEFKFMKRDERDLLKKVPLILITDGSPNNRPATEEALIKIKRTVHVFGIGIFLSGSSENHFKRCLGNNFINIENIENVGTELIKISKKIIKKY